MAVTYTKVTDVALLDPLELGERLADVVLQSLPWLQTLTDAKASRPEDLGKWCAKEVIGHLIDSAVNNIARVIRLQKEDQPDLPGYEQTAWVELQHYSERTWVDILALWSAINEHFSCAVKHIEKEKLAKKGQVAGGELTLGFLIEDYIAHMQHHLSLLKLWAWA